MVVRGVIRRKGRIDLAQASENVLIRLHHSTPPVAPWLRQKSSAKTGWVARSKLRGNLDSRHPQGFCRVTRLPVNAALGGGHRARISSVSSCHSAPVERKQQVTAHPSSRPLSSIHRS